METFFLDFTGRIIILIMSRKFTQKTVEFYNKGTKTQILIVIDDLNGVVVSNADC
jgi:hypothetical protein